MILMQQNIEQQKNLQYYIIKTKIQQRPELNRVDCRSELVYTKQHHNKIYKSSKV